VEGRREAAGREAERGGETRENLIRQYVSSPTRPREGKGGREQEGERRRETEVEKERALSSTDGGALRDHTTPAAQQNRVVRARVLG